MMKKIFSVGLLVVSIGILGACSDKAAVSESTESKTQESSKISETVSSVSESSSSATPEKKYYGIGEEIKIGDGSKELIKLKFVEVSTNQSVFPEHMISLANYDTTKMVAVKIEYTNVGVSGQYKPLPSDFVAYDSNNKALTQVNQMNGQDDVSQGRSSVTQLFWELPVSGNEVNSIEIDFTPYISAENISGDPITFKLDVSH